MSRTGGHRGEALLSYPVVWLGLGDFEGNSKILYDPGCAVTSNLSSGRELLEKLADGYGITLRRLTFIQTVMDEGPPWKGILYLAYYPSFNETWIVVSGISLEDVSSSTVRVDGVQKMTEVTYPFIRVYGHVPDGIHSLVLGAGGEEYGLPLNPHTSPVNIEWVASGIKENGEFYGVLSHLNNTMQIDYLMGTLDGQTQGRELNLTALPYNTTRVELNFTKKLNPGEYYPLDLMISYKLDGIRMWLNQSVRLPAE